MRALTMRPPTEEERKVIEKLAASRTAPACQLQRARLLKRLAAGLSAPKAAASLGGMSAETVCRLLKRFNQEGLQALEDRPRSGRPQVISEEDRGRLVMLAQSPPPQGTEQGQGACHWVLDSLLAAARSQGIVIGRTHLWRVLNQEGIRWWRRGRSWLTSLDPELPQKRGTLSAFTPHRRREAR